MITLSHGVQKPQTGDKGAVFFPALEDNCDILNDHNHDGVNSEAIPSINITKTTQNLSAASWVAYADGLYRQLVTVPSGKSFDNSVPVFRESVSKDTLLLDTEKVSTTTYYVYCNDSSISLVVIYS